MFITEKTLTIRDFGAFGPGLDILRDDKHYAIIDWNTGVHYRLNEDTGIINLGGDNWGTVERLLDKEILDMGFYLDGTEVFTLALS